MLQLSNEEKGEFIRLTEKKLGLIELTKHIHIVLNKELYDQVIKDLGEATRRLNSFWLTIKKKYNLIDVSENELSIDLESGIINRITTPIDKDVKIF